MNKQIINSIEIYINQYISRLPYKADKIDVIDQTIIRLDKIKRKIKRGKIK